jgi:hypothetical protein
MRGNRKDLDKGLAPKDKDREVGLADAGVKRFEKLISFEEVVVADANSGSVCTGLDPRVELRGTVTVV